MLNPIRILKIASCLLVFLLAGCSTLVTIAPNQVAQLPSVQIVRVSTPPLIRNTWTESYLRAYPNAPLAKALNASSEKPRGLLPPDIPDFGEILGKEILKRFPENSWWPKTTMSDVTVNSIDELTSGNYLTIEFEEMRISGGGQFFTVVRIKLLNTSNQILWDKRSSYNGVFESKGDNLDTRLLKGFSHVESEFQYAARYIVQGLLTSMPR
jgi:hypothetical protein